MNNQLKTIAIIIPAYNEEKMISKVIKSLINVFQNQSFNYKIIVVDDGSSDKTAILAERAGAKVIKHIINIGSGGSTATGLSYALQKNFDLAATLDGDGQHDPKDVLNGINILINNSFDLLIGSRLLSKNDMSSSKKIGNKGLSFITYLLFGVKVTDSQSGLRIFSKTALSDLKWKTNGYEYCSEMLWRANQLKLNISEFPITTIYTDYSKSKGQNNWNAFNIIKTLLKRRIMELFNE